MVIASQMELDMVEEEADMVVGVPLEDQGVVLDQEVREVALVRHEGLQQADDMVPAARVPQAVDTEPDLEEVDTAVQGEVPLLVQQVEAGEEESAADVGAMEEPVVTLVLVRVLRLPEARLEDLDHADARLAISEVVVEGRPVVIGPDEGEADHTAVQGARVHARVVLVRPGRGVVAEGAPDLDLIAVHAPDRGAALTADQGHGHHVQDRFQLARVEVGGGVLFQNGEMRAKIAKGAAKAVTFGAANRVVEARVTLPRAFKVSSCGFKLHVCLNLRSKHYLLIAIYIYNLATAIWFLITERIGVCNKGPVPCLVLLKNRPQTTTHVYSKSPGRRMAWLIHSSSASSKAYPGPPAMLKTTGSSTRPCITPEMIKVSHIRK